MIQDNRMATSSGEAVEALALINLGQASVETRGAGESTPEIVGLQPNMGVFQD